MKPATDQTGQVAMIVAAVAKAYELEPDQILSDRKEGVIGSARSLCYWLTREVTPEHIPLSDIARAFNRDRTSLIAGIKKTELRRQEPAFADLTNQLLRLVQATGRAA